MPRLENWTFLPTLAAKTVSPGKEGVIIGEIFDDERERFPDGRQVCTSIIKNFDPESGQTQTRNTLYELGTPAPETGSPLS